MYSELTGCILRQFNKLLSTVVYCIGNFIHKIRPRFRFFKYIQHRSFGRFSESGWRPVYTVGVGVIANKDWPEHDALQWRHTTRRDADLNCSSVVFWNNAYFKAVFFSALRYSSKVCVGYLLCVIVVLYYVEKSAIGTLFCERPAQRFYASFFCCCCNAMTSLLLFTKKGQCHHSHCNCHVVSAHLIPSDNFFIISARYYFSLARINRDFGGDTDIVT